MKSSSAPVSGTVVTWGSPRQGREFAATASAYDLACRHITEADLPGVTRSVADLVREGRRVVTAATSPVVGFVAFGRATVVGGIEAIARTWDQLRAEGGLDDVTLVGPSARAAAVLSDKWTTAELAEAIGFAVPSNRLVTARDIASLDYPCVLKARVLTGGAGIALVGSVAEAESYFIALAAAGLFEALASAYVEGMEVSVELLKLGDKWMSFPLGTKGSTSWLMRHADDKVKLYGHLGITSPYVDRAIRLGDELGIQGLLSVEGVLTAREPREWLLLEAAPRVTGNLPMELASVGHYSVYDAFAQHIAGASVDPIGESKHLAAEVPLYAHADDLTLARLIALPNVSRAVLDDLSTLPAATRVGARIRVGFSGTDAASVAQTARRLDELCPGDNVVSRLADAAQDVLDVFDSAVLQDLLGLLR